MSVLGTAHDPRSPEAAENAAAMRGLVADLRALAQRDGFDFKVTAVPPNLVLPPYQPFDAAYMNTLFQAGLATGRSARGWADEAGPLLGQR